MTVVRRNKDRSGGRQRSDIQSSENVTTIGFKLKNLKNSLAEVLSRIDVSIYSEETDEVFVKSGLRKEEWQEPLTWNEAAVIACALTQEKEERPFTYIDVMFLTQEHTGQAMVTGAVYRAIQNLIQRGLIIEAGTVKNFDRAAQAYRTNELGRRAFKEAVLAAQTLRLAREVKAA